MEANIIEEVKVDPETLDFAIEDEKINLAIHNFQQPIQIFSMCPKGDYFIIKFEEDPTIYFYKNGNQQTWYKETTKDLGIKLREKNYTKLALAKWLQDKIYVLDLKSRNHEIKGEDEYRLLFNLELTILEKDANYIYSSSGKGWLNNRTRELDVKLTKLFKTPEIYLEFFEVSVIRGKDIIILGFSTGYLKAFDLSSYRPVEIYEKDLGKEISSLYFLLNPSKFDWHSYATPEIFEVYGSYSFTKDSEMDEVILGCLGGKIMIFALNSLIKGLVEKIGIELDPGFKANIKQIQILEEFYVLIASNSIGIIKKQNITLLKNRIVSEVKYHDKFKNLEHLLETCVNNNSDENTKNKHFFELLKEYSLLYLSDKNVWNEILKDFNDKSLKSQFNIERILELHLKLMKFPKFKNFSILFLPNFEVKSELKSILLEKFLNDMPSKMQCSVLDSFSYTWRSSLKINLPQNFEFIIGDLMFYGSNILDFINTKDDTISLELRDDIEKYIDIPQEGKLTEFVLGKLKDFYDYFVLRRAYLSLRDSNYFEGTIYFLLAITEAIWDYITSKIWDLRHYYHNRVKKILAHIVYYPLFLLLIIVGILCFVTFFILISLEKLVCLAIHITLFSAEILLTLLIAPINLKKVCLIYFSTSYGINTVALEEDIKKSECLLKVFFISADEGDRIFESLKSTPQTDPIFQSETIAALVRHRWEKEIKIQFYRRTFFYVLILTVISLDILWLFTYRPSLGNIVDYFPFYYLAFNIIMDLSVIVILLYLFFEEQGEMLSFKEYIENLWNILDLFLIYSGLFSMIYDMYFLISLKDPDEVVKYTMAIFFFLAWFRLLDFLRGIKATSTLLSLLSRVGSEMYGFLFVLLYLVAGLAFTCFLLQGSHLRNNPWEVFQFMYFLLLGDFDGYNSLYNNPAPEPTAPGDILLAPSIFFLIFLISTIFIVIVMLNLLIAIISDAYEKVMLDIKGNEIYETLYLINEERLKQSSKRREYFETMKNRLIICITQVQSGVEGTDSKDRLRTKIAKMEQKITEDIANLRIEMKNDFSNLENLIKSHIKNKDG